ncbi:MAG: cupin domain-containing protein [Bacteroidia bacterium]|nr:cupin domain-containing protein [Bacteroidia bacterium]
MLRLFIIIALASLLFPVKAQQYLTDTIGKTSLTNNIYNKPLFSDSLTSSFCIVIKKEVRAHRHLHHSEHVVVIEGQGLMKLGDKNFIIKKGDVIFIPKNTVHSVKSTGEIPLKVISVQSPRFDGTDRIFEAEE